MLLFKKVLLKTRDQNQLNQIRGALENHHITYSLKTDSLKMALTLGIHDGSAVKPLLTPGKQMQYEYTILVKRKDYVFAQKVFNQCRTF